MRFERLTQVRIATIALATITLILAAPLAQARGVETEMVWANGVQIKMTVPNAHFPATPNAKLDAFYVVAPQLPPAHQSTETGGDPPFHHDHVLDAPSQNHGDYNVHWHAFLVLCSGQGISSGSCVPTMTPTPQGTIPLAMMVNGQMLTSVGPIESPANSGLIVLVDTGVIFVCALNPGQ